MESSEQFAYFIPAFLDLVVPLTAEQLTLPTPCTDWTVCDLLEHMTTGANMFASALSGDEPRADPGDVRVAIVDALKGFAHALDTPGAFDRVIPEFPFGEATGDTLAHYAAFDLLMHSWDLSRATGRPLKTSEAVIAAVDSWARAWLVEAFRQPGMFAPETPTPESATDLERLVAFSGRDLGWSSRPRLGKLSP
jgi:uncharacterized protein (TIGR03086 family)